MLLDGCPSRAIAMHKPAATQTTEVQRSLHVRCTFHSPHPTDPQSFVCRLPTRFRLPSFSSKQVQELDARDRDQKRPSASETFFSKRRLQTRRYGYIGLRDSINTGVDTIARAQYLLQLHHSPVALVDPQRGCQPELHPVDDRRCAAVAQHLRALPNIQERPEPLFSFIAWSWALIIKQLSLVPARSQPPELSNGRCIMRLTGR